MVVEVERRRGTRRARITRLSKKFRPVVVRPDPSVSRELFQHGKDFGGGREGTAEETLRESFEEKEEQQSLLRKG